MVDFAFFKNDVSNTCSWQHPLKLALAIKTFSKVSSIMLALNLFLVLFTILKILSHSALLWGIDNIANIIFESSLYLKVPSTFLMFPMRCHCVSILSDFKASKFSNCNEQNWFCNVSIATSASIFLNSNCNRIGNLLRKYLISEKVALEKEDMFATLAWIITSSFIGNLLTI